MLPLLKQENHQSLVIFVDSTPEVVSVHTCSTIRIRYPLCVRN